MGVKHRAGSAGCPRGGRRALGCRGCGHLDTSQPGGHPSAWEGSLAHRSAALQAAAGPPAEQGTPTAVRGPSNSAGTPQHFRDPSAVQGPAGSAGTPRRCRDPPSSSGTPGAGWAPQRCCCCWAVFAGSKGPAIGAALVGHHRVTWVTSIYVASRAKAPCSRVCRCSKPVTGRQDCKNKLM